jgi:hypothetical protein
MLAGLKNKLGGVAQAVVPATEEAEVGESIPRRPQAKLV